MRYFSPSGLEISRNEWLFHFTEMKNLFVASTCINDLFVETAWVGIAHDAEKDPKLFVTTVFGFEEQGFDDGKLDDVCDKVALWEKIPLKNFPDMWDTDEASAIKTHNRIVDKLRIFLFDMRPCKKSKWG